MLGSVSMNTCAPMRCAASRASCGSTGRLCVSARMATVSPFCSAQRRSTCSKASNQPGSMISCNMRRLSDNRAAFAGIAGKRIWPHYS